MSPVLRRCSCPILNKTRPGCQAMSTLENERESLAEATRKLDSSLREVQLLRSAVEEAKAKVPILLRAINIKDSFPRGISPARPLSSLEEVVHTGREKIVRKLSENYCTVIGKFFPRLGRSFCRQKNSKPIAISGVQGTPQHVLPPSVP